jgi:hypothetical protein
MSLYPDTVNTNLSCLCILTQLMSLYPDTENNSLSCLCILTQLILTCHVSVS